MYKRVHFFQPRTFAQNNYQNSAGGEQQWVPWFALILSPAVKRQGLETHLIDARVSEQWQAKVGKLGPQDVLAVSVMTGHAINDALIASRIAQARGAFVVWGGPHVTLFPHQTLHEARVDAVVLGFGFMPFYSLIANIVTQPNRIYKYPNILFSKDTTEFTETPNSFYYADELLPPCDLDLIDNWVPYVNADVAIAPRTINFITSEGCPRFCTFCSEPATSRRVWFTRSVHQSIETAIDLIHRSGANGLKLHDPNFFHNKERAQIFAKGFWTETSVPWAATLHPEDLLNMSDSELHMFAEHGLSRVLVGLESPLETIVRLAGKKYDPKSIPTLVRRLATAKIRGMFTFIVGWPGASPDHYDATLRCASEIKDVWHEHQAKIHFLEPWPGTPMFHLAVKQGLVPPSSLSEWAEIDYYHAQYMSIHDISLTEKIHEANSKLSPYVDA